jgi:DNA (cytosine-5)-methyltransferase 1
LFERIIGDLSAPATALREGVRSASTSQTRRTPEYTIFSFVHGIDGAEALRPQDYVIETEKFGIPQSRHRLILLGIRNDLIKPRGLCLRPSAPPSVSDLISDLPRLRSQLSDRKEDQQMWFNMISEGLLNLRASDFEPQIWNEMQNAAAVLKRLINVGGRSVERNQPFKLSSKKLANWICDSRMSFVCNHEARRHMTKDLIRYLFVSSYAKVRGSSPKLHNFPSMLLPNHKNVGNAIKGRNGNFNDRFRVQVEWAPATTVTAHMAKDGHYFIHHDPTQCRTWTVREAARIQTFPDNYFFEGSRTDQYRQVGNAVPPFLALQLAEMVARLFEAQL